MTEWYSGLEALEKTYWIITLIGTLFFIVILISTFVGGDMDELGDADFDGGIDFQFLSFKNMVGFVTIFGWSGLASIYANNSDGLTLIISLICGTVMMTLMAALFYILRNTGESGTLKIQNAVGVVGEVYLPIKANRESIGKVSIKVQGSLRELEALTDESFDLQSGNVIKVLEVVSDEILLVEKFKKLK